MVFKLKYFTSGNLTEIRQLDSFNMEKIKEMQVVSKVFPFRVNNYVIDNLIDWNNIPEDPIYQLTFPQKEMLKPKHFTRIYDMLFKQKATQEELQLFIYSIYNELNPHCSSQFSNIPQEYKRRAGIQHKYKETVLIFPQHGQVCHAHCTFCFRWPQFISHNSDLRFITKDLDKLKAYLKTHKEISDVILTGGDPMVATTEKLKPYFDIFLSPELKHIRNIRVGTKALTFYPHRFVNSNESDQLLSLFENAVKSGKSVAIMAHFNHPVELEPQITQLAITRIKETGAIIRSQSPIVNHINADEQIWVDLWRTQVKLGIIPYYMFIPRNTGASEYFKVPIDKACTIYRKVAGRLSGIEQTAKGPVMSTHFGKIKIDGVTKIHDKDVFVLRFLRARNHNWVQKPFFAEYSSKATWLDQLKPFNSTKFFFEL